MHKRLTEWFIQSWILSFINKADFVNIVAFKYSEWLLISATGARFPRGWR